MSDAASRLKRLRWAFARAASNYDQIDQVPREINERLLQRLELLRLPVQTIVDAGSGTGYATSLLLRRFGHASLISLDLSDTMLRAGRKRGGLSRWFRRASRGLAVCADMQCMPFAASSVDLIWSNLAFHWATDLPRVLAEMFQVLRPGGLLVFSMCGPDTLLELRAARQGDAFRVNSLVDMHDIGDLLVACGFSDPVMDMERLTLTYSDVPSLIRDLRAHGSVALSPRASHGLVGKVLFSRLISDYEAFRRDDGRLPATLEIIFGHAWKMGWGDAAGGRPVIPIRPAY